MNILTIPKKFISNSDDDLVIIPRKQYEHFLDIGKQLKERLFEEADTDESIATYKKEKKQGKLKVIKSLSSFR